jgi:hypothetical protein
MESPVAVTRRGLHTPSSLPSFSPSGGGAINLRRTAVEWCTSHSPTVPHRFPRIPSGRTSSTGREHVGRGAAVRDADNTPRPRSKKRTFPKIYPQPHAYHEGK